MDAAVGLPPGFVLDQAPAANSALPPGFVLDQPSTGADIAKGAGTGLVQGAIGTAGMGGDLRELGIAGANKIVNALTGSDMSPDARSALNTALKVMPGIASGPSSADIKGMTGNLGVPVPDYQPQTTAGKVAKSIGEFAPAALGGGGGIVRRVAQVVIPALASEAAGEATQGTAAEPYAKAGAAILGSIAAHRVTAPRAPAPVMPSSEDVVSAGAAAYKDPAVTGMTYKTGVVENIADNTLNDLSKMKFNDRLAPQTRAVVEDMKTPVGNLHTFEDYQTTRQMLGKLAANFSNPTEQAAATQAINRLDKYFNGLKQSDLASGDLAQGMATLQQGRQNYALGKVAQRVEEGLNRAEVNASSAHSGGNIDNATRQALKPMLLSPKKARGLSDADLTGIENVVAGSTTGNAFRAAGKLLGGGGGLGALVTGGIGHAALGPLGIAAPFVGYGLKKAGDAITRRNAQAVVANILARSPEAQRFAALNARYAPAGAGAQGLLPQAVLSALLSSAAPRALLPYQSGVAVQQ